MTRKILLILLVSIGVRIQLWAQTQKLASPEDFVGFRELQDVQISPDGKQVAFVVTENGDLDIWLVPTDGKEPARPYAVSIHDESSPRWSSDGRYFTFLSNRGEDNNLQIYLLRTDGGEAKQISWMQGGVRAFKWSCDGSMIAFTSKDALSAEEKEKRKQGDDVILVDQNPQYTRLWVQGLKTGNAELVTEQDFNVKDFAWSTDGSELAIITDDKLVIVSRANGKVVRTLSENVASPQTRRKIFDWSPDGRTILFSELSPTRVGSWMTVASADGSESHPLLKDYKGTISKAIWGPDSQHIFAQSFERTASKLLRINVKTGLVTVLADEIFRVKPDFSISADGRKAAYLNSSVTEPWDVWMYSMDLGMQRLTHLHPQVASLRLGKVKEVNWRNEENNQDLYGVLVMPVNYEPGKSYPTVTQIHGGPHIAWARGWLGSWHDWAQFLAANGYVVFLPNPRGSMGQGAKFSEANVGDLGGGDFRDIMAGIDYLEKEGIADPERLGVGGWSYGGYMTARTITKTKRFKAAVVGAGITDVVSHVLSSHHGLNWTRTYSLDVPARHPDIYEQVSPINYLQNVVTPTLVLHGEKDPKVNVRQGYEFYFGLKTLNVETEMAIYPRQGHGIREQAHQLDFMRRLLAWYNKHLKKT